MSHVFVTAEQALGVFMLSEAERDDDTLIGKGVHAHHPPERPQRKSGSPHPARRDKIVPYNVIVPVWIRDTRPASSICERDGFIPHARHFTFSPVLT